MTPRIATGRVNCAANAQYTSTPALTAPKPELLRRFVLRRGLRTTRLAFYTLALLLRPNGDARRVPDELFSVLNANEALGGSASSRPGANVIVTSVVPGHHKPWSRRKRLSLEQHDTPTPFFCRPSPHPELRPRRSHYACVLRSRCANESSKLIRSPSFQCRVIDRMQ